MPCEVAHGAKAVTEGITHLQSVFFPWFPSPSLGATFSYGSTKVLLLLGDWFVFILRLGVVWVVPLPFLFHLLGNLEPRCGLHSKTIVMQEPGHSPQKNSLPPFPKVKTQWTTYCITWGALLNSLQWPEWEGSPQGGDMCIHMADSSLCYTAETNRTL